MSETIESVLKWADETFGPCTSLDVARRRVKDEMLEFYSAIRNEHIIDEAADVWITLARIPGIQEAIDKKMAINRARPWISNGDGTGQHLT